MPPAGNENVILFLHGFMGRGDDWLPLTALLGKDITCLTPDLPGHGNNLRNEWPEGFLFPAWAAELTAWLESAGIGSCHLAGYSMGGRLALYLALTRPALVRSLILESASPGITDELERTRRLQHDRALAEKFLSGSWPGLLEEWYDQPVFSGIKDRAGFRSLYQRRLENDPEQLAAVLRGTSPGLQPPVWGLLSDLKMPVLALAGGHDLKYSREVQKMREFNPGIKTAVISEAGHNIHFEAPERLAEEIGYFISLRTEE